MRIPWWTFLRVSARWELDRLRCRWRGMTAEAAGPIAEPDPGLPVRAPLPAADSTHAAPAYTIPEECRLRILAEWLGASSDGTRELGGSLAGALRKSLPDTGDRDIAKVLLALLPVLEALAAEQPDAEAALQVIWDSLLGGPPVLAELDLALAERGSW